MEKEKKFSAEHVARAYHGMLSLILIIGAGLIGLACTVGTIWFATPAMLLTYIVLVAGFLMILWRPISIACTSLALEGIDLYMPISIGCLIVFAVINGKISAWVHQLTGSVFLWFVYIVLTSFWYGFASGRKLRNWLDSLKNEEE